MTETPALVERDTALAVLARALADAGVGRGRVVAVHGPAGSGKSALLAVALASADARVLRARARRIEQDLAFGVAAQLLGEDAMGRRELQRRLGSLAVLQPLVLAVDDAQLADRETLRWLAYAAERIETLPVALLVAIGDGEPAADPAALEALLGAATALRLEPLSAAGTATMLGSDDALARRVHALTGGLPALVALVRDELTASTDLDAFVPPALGRVLTARLDRLGSDFDAVARAVAVLGDAAVRDVALVAQLPVARVAEVADALAAVGVLAHGRPLRFAQALVRTAALGGLMPSQRAMLELRAGRALVAAGADSVVAAHHVAAAELAGDPWVVEALVAGAAAADDAEAVTLLRRALAEPPPAARRAWLLLELGAREQKLGLPEAREHLQRSWSALPPGPERVRAAQALARALVDRGRLDEATGVLRQAVDEASPSAAPALAGELAANARYLGEAMNSTVEVRDPRAERLRLADAAFDAFRAVRPQAEVLALCRRALGDGELLGENLTSLYAALVPLILSDDLELAAGWLERARASGSGLSETLARSWLAFIDIARGSVDAAARDSLAACTDCRVQGFVMVLPIALAARVAALTAQGALTEAAAEAAVDLPAEVARLPHSAQLVLARSQLRLALGDHAGALDDALASGELMAAFGTVNPAGLGWRSAAALALAEQDPDGASALVGEELWLAERYGSARARAGALLTSGRLAGGDPASLGRAVVLARRCGATLLECEALIALGAALRRLGRRTEARAELRAGLELALAGGAGRLAALARSELAIAGARPRRERLTGPDALTPGERRVAELAARGATNREIARELTVSIKTVEWHLSHAYTKLAIGSRVELADALVELS